MEKPITAEQRRLNENKENHAPWHRWGPYVSERQWGTVREDYSPDGSAWDYFTHDQARSRVYRWGEDGIGGFSDRHGLMNFTVAVWNHKDPILKERLFGLTNSEGNHGEDVKELYYYLDAVPSHAYLKMLYRYPQAEFPYGDLVQENKQRGFGLPEYELLDTGVFEENKFFDVVVEYAKATSEDILWRVTITNQGPESAPFTLLPQLTARNRWSWSTAEGRPEFRQLDGSSVLCETGRYGKRWLYSEDGTFIFTENDSNAERLFGVANESPFVKDSFHRYVIDSETEAINPENFGTKVGLLVQGTLAPGESRTVSLRFSDLEHEAPFADFLRIFDLRKTETDEFYDSVSMATDHEHKRVQRQAFAGLIWSKQYYHYDYDRWVSGDPLQPPPPQSHANRNKGWNHFHAGEVLSMPDKWEYPWFAAWDLAFHTLPFTLIDPQFAKEQLTLLLREWYMHPNGQIPAYEWNFSDVNPPVHAWAALRVFRIDWRINNVPDYAFLEKTFHKLLMNFTWWTNRKDEGGNNVFEGGFLGLDNIGLFDRNMPLEDGTYLEQSDGTSWMAMFCLNMLDIAVELTRNDPTYEEVASKFFEHFVYIADAMHESGLWNEEDGFYYDVLTTNAGKHMPIKVRSMVGLIPIYAVSVLEPMDLVRMPNFARRLKWFTTNRPNLVKNFYAETSDGEMKRHVFSLVSPERLARLCSRMLDETEFLADHGIRGLSKVYDSSPYMQDVNGVPHSIGYDPAESRSGMFGGNSNWRGPIWMPVNYLLVESLQKYHYFLGDTLKVEFPTGSGSQKNLWEVSLMLSSRMIDTFLPDSTGKRPVHENIRYANDPLWKDLVLFYEYFCGNTGRGVGASHQTGWTALVAKMIDQVNLWK